MTALARVAVVLTGGTFDSLGVDRLDLAWYYESGRRMGPAEVLASVPELTQVADVEIVPYARLSSSAVTPVDWIALANRIADLLEPTSARPSFDGVVVTHGTNTIEETAYFLDLVLPAGPPVVLVGAMRPPSGIGSDAAANLFRAVQVAAAPGAAGLGVLVLMDDTVHAARFVTKSATFRVGAFSSRDVGPLGFADADGRVVLYQAPLRLSAPARFEVSSLHGLPRVDVTVSYAGADGALIDAAVAAGAVGIVAAGTGAGRVTPEEDAALDRAVESGVAVALASRVGSGRVAVSLTDRDRGRIGADNLPAWKARILLALGLTKTRDPQRLQGFFDSF